MVTSAAPVATFLLAGVPPDPHADPAALVEAMALLRQAVEKYEGRVIPAPGDTFCAIFRTTPAALLAALEVWRPPDVEAGAFPLRLTLHNGPAVPQAGPELDSLLAAGTALLAAGHAGQLLFGQAVAGAVGPYIPQGAGVRDLGVQRLTDLISRAHIYQLVDTVTPTHFPPLNTLDQRPNNLSLQLSPLLGRRQELAHLTRLLRDGDARLLTLIGAAGTGKTRLALQVAADLLGDFPDGVWVVSLSTIADPDWVTSAIAQALGVQEAAGVTPLAGLEAYMRERRLLLVLDNFEQLEPAAPSVAALLAAAPGLQVLVTSRESLHLPGEQTIAVDPLRLPDLNPLPSLAELGRVEAVALFVARTREVNPAFVLTQANAAAVAEICVRLDGLPLALELAAARSNALPPATMLARLQATPDHGSLPLLAGGASYLPSRQRTMRAAIGWSYALLEPAEQTLFAHLAVFVGGWTVEAAEDVVPDQNSVTAGLESLRDKSLLRREIRADGTLRYRMLSTVHEYALEELEARGELATLRRRHAVYYRDLAEQAAPQLRGTAQVAWLDRLAHEHDNFRAALRWAAETGEPELGLRLAGALWRFWRVRGYLREGRRWLESGLQAAGPVDPAVRALALEAASVLAWSQGDYAPAQDYAEQSLALRRTLADSDALAAALRNLAVIDGSLGNYARAEACYEESLAIFQAAGDQAWIGRVLNNLGELARIRGDYARAVGLHEQSLAIFRALGDKTVMTWTLYSLGQAAREAGDRLDRAGAFFVESLTLFREIEGTVGIAYCLAGLGELAQAYGWPDRAARLFGAVDALLTAAGAHFWPTDHQGYETAVAAARAALEPDTWDTAWAEGQAMTVDEACSYALAAA
jgi:predicted ATPase